MKKILIASRWCTPARNPRAFRTAELLDEFLQREYDITVFLPDEAKISKKIRHIKVGSKCFNTSAKYVFGKKTHSENVYVNKAKKIFGYFFGDGIRTLLYTYSLYGLAKSHLRKEHDYDVILSISYPFYVNVAVALLKRYVSPMTILIADCGDPFYANPSFPKAFYLKYLEKWVLNQFNYITIPIESARGSYLEYLPSERIKVIPQGFKLIDIQENTYHKNHVPTFGYAGVFYESIRNPRYFFEYLLTLKQVFHFVVYAIADGFTVRLLSEYKEKLGEKLEICEAVDRDVLIPKMAAWELS